MLLLLHVLLLLLLLPIKYDIIVNIKIINEIIDRMLLLLWYCLSCFRDLFMFLKLNWLQYTVSMQSCWTVVMILFYSFLFYSISLIVLVVDVKKK
jgi:hypothetical protein